MLKHIEIFKKDRPSPAEAINNVYKLPSIEPETIYLHGAASSPTKSNWLKVIRNGSYLLWPLVNIKMSTSISQSQKKPKKGTCAPNGKDCDPPRPNNPPEPLLQEESTSVQTPIPKKKEFFIKIYSSKNTMYTDQTGKFPHLSSQGNNYQMIIH